MKTILAVIGGLVVLFILTMFAVCNDDDDSNGWARIQIASHEYDGGGYDDGGDCDWEGDCGGQRYDQNYGSRDDRNRNRNRDRGAFSPGPFRDSPVTICLPNSCNSDGRGRGDEPPPEEERS